MERTSSHEAGLMAAWIATGGAGDALRETAGEDDGLAALGFSRSAHYCGDDGITAAMPTREFYVCGDDGLEAGHHTGFGCLLIDDGLAATTSTVPTALCHADDGLTAGGYASTIGAFCW
ncbi:hypothetical protein [Shumkonia mesophila]|uniref:hypothetical protein n=1 Tax=Shumkonia mesophila TaxID=2838854 RepID=UPI002934F4C4|nr:hypothetical protein [Shumkonia mesophila]